MEKKKVISVQQAHNCYVEETLDNDFPPIIMKF